MRSSVMARAYRRQHQTYDHRIREAIASTGNPHLYRNIPIPISTRRTWSSGRIEPVVTSDEADLKAYELLDQLERLKHRSRQQAAVIGLLTRLLNIRGGSSTEIGSLTGPASLRSCAPSHQPAICSGCLPSCASWVCRRHGTMRGSEKNKAAVLTTNRAAQDCFQPC